MRLLRITPMLGAVLAAGCRDGTAPLSPRGAPTRSAAHFTATLSSWHQRLPTGTAPSGRYLNANTAFDEVNDRLIIFGGYDEGLRNDLWVLANSSGALGQPEWIQLAPVGGPPPARTAHTTVYDAGANRLIVHGGCGGQCSPALADTWVLTNANGLGGAPEWIQLPDAPVARVGHSAAYDAASNRMVVFGGHEGFFGTARNDVWVFASANGLGTPTWIEIAPAGTPPAPRDAASVLYDGASGRLLLFGGQQFVSDVEGTAFGDLWALTNATGVLGVAAWIDLTPAGAGPAPRASAVLGHDRARNRAIVYGGIKELNAPVVFYGDVWQLDGANGTSGPPVWTQLQPAGTSPLARYRHTGAYSPVGGGLVTAYGSAQGAAGYQTDVWLLRLQDVIDVAIDVRPGSDRNPIQAGSSGVIPVAILTTPAFDAGTVATASVRFGAAGTEASSVHVARADIDGDGDVDLVLHFRLEATGLQCGAQLARLEGTTISGLGIRGSDAVMMVGCR